jgi:hypothetical protein
MSLETKFEAERDFTWILGPECSRSLSEMTVFLFISLFLSANGNNLQHFELYSINFNSRRKYFNFPKIRKLLINFKVLNLMHSH